MNGTVKPCKNPKDNTNHVRNSKLKPTEIPTPFGGKWGVFFRPTAITQLPQVWASMVREGEGGGGWEGGQGVCPTRNYGNFYFLKRYLLHFDTTLVFNGGTWSDIIARKVYRNVSHTDRKIILIPGFLKTGVAKISTHSTTWPFNPWTHKRGGGGGGGLRCHPLIRFFWVFSQRIKHQHLTFSVAVRSSLA